MSRKPLVDVDEVVSVTANFESYYGLAVSVRILRAVVQDVVTKYEAALDSPAVVTMHRLREQHAELRDQNAELRKRIADLEATPRYETLADYYRPKDDLEMVSRRIDKLADRVAQLEREQREGQGEL